MGPVRKLVIGSSPEEIFRQARIPVHTIGPDVWREPRYGIELKNILFATAFLWTRSGKTSYLSLFSRPATPVSHPS